MEQVRLRIGSRIRDVGAVQLLKDSRGYEILSFHFVIDLAIPRAFHTFSFVGYIRNFNTIRLIETSDSSESIVSQFSFLDELQNNRWREYQIPNTNYFILNPVVTMTKILAISSRSNRSSIYIFFKV